MHSHWTNKRDIKLQFYALKRFETRQVPFVFGASKSSLFITQDSTCLPASPQPRSTPACRRDASFCSAATGWARDEVCVTRCVYSTNNRRVRKKKGGTGALWKETEAGDATSERKESPGDGERRRGRRRVAGCVVAWLDCDLARICGGHAMVAKSGRHKQ